MTNKLSDETVRELGIALFELKKCWKPSGGMLRLDMNLAFNWIGDHANLVETILEKARAELEGE